MRGVQDKEARVMYPDSDALANSDALVLELLLRRLLGGRGLLLLLLLDLQLLLDDL